MLNLAKYDVALNRKRHEESRLLLGTNKKDTRLGVFFIWDPAVTYSPGPLRRLHRPLGAPGFALAKYNVARCRDNQTIS